MALSPPNTMQIRLEFGSLLLFMIDFGACIRAAFLTRLKKDCPLKISPRLQKKKKNLLYRERPSKNLLINLFQERNNN